MTKLREESRSLVFFYLCALFAGSVLFPLAFSFLLAIVFAYVCEQPLRWLLASFAKLQRKSSLFTSGKLSYIKKVRAFNKVTKPLLCSIFITFIVMLVFIPFVFSCVFIFNQTARLLSSHEAIQMAPKIVKGAAALISAKLENIGVEISMAQILSHVRNLLSQLSNILLENLQQLLSGTPLGVAKIVIFLFSWQMFLLHGKRWRKEFLPLLIPFKTEREIIAQTTGDVLKAVVLSNVIVSALQALLVCILLLATSVPNAIVWAGLSFFTSFIPVVGTAGVLLGAAGYLYSGGGTLGPIVLIFGSVIVGTADNFVRPIFVKGRVDLSFFWIMVAFFGGVYQYGIAGAVLGPLAFALFLSSLRCFRRNALQNKNLAI